MTDDRSRSTEYPLLGGEEVAVVPWPLLLRQRLAGRVQESGRFRWWVMWAVLGGLFSVNITFTILAIALPRMAGELDASENTLTWVITGPLLAFGVAAPILGKAGDAFGHRRLYLIGMAGALVAAGLSAAAWSAPSLIAARVLGSVEGAATGAASMALIFSVFERNDRVKAMGWWSLVGAGGPVMGVALGGPVIEAFGWRWIFVAQVPLIAVAMVVASVILPETERRQHQRIDWPGALALVTAATGLLMALNRGPEWGWTDSIVILGFAVFPPAAVAFVLIERRAPHPLLPLTYLRRRNFAWPIGAQVFSNFAYMGGFILAPSLLNRVFGYDEGRVGFMVMSRPIAFAVVAPIAGYLAVRLGERSAAVTGAVTVAASMVAFAAVGADSSDLTIIGALVLSGIGLGISSPSIAASVGNAVDEGDLGIASASQQLMTQIGIVAGIQLMKTVQASRESSVGLVESFGDAYLLGGAVCLLAVVCAFFVQSAQRLPAPSREPLVGPASIR